MEGNSYNVQFGGWVHHRTEGFQNRTMIRMDNPANVCSFDITFTHLFGVFGSMCETYIPLSVMEGLEIWLRLDNIANVLKYQFVLHPPAEALDKSAYKAKAYSHAKIHQTWKDTVLNGKVQ